MQLDWCVGELTKTLDRLGLANTLIVFCSDNGPVDDPGERNDVAQKNPAVLNELTSQLDKLLDEKSSRPQ